MCAGRRSVVGLLVSALILAACGGRSSAPSADPADTSPGNGTATQPQAQAIPPDLQVPKSVPQRATGPARRSSTRVIRRWLAALDRGDVERAAHYFALPSTFQNTGTPVLHIDSEEERIAVNLSLTCGARAERTGGAGRLHDRAVPAGRAHRPGRRLRHGRRRDRPRRDPRVGRPHPRVVPAARRPVRGAGRAGGSERLTKRPLRRGSGSSISSRSCSPAGRSGAR